MKIAPLALEESGGEDGSSTSPEVQTSLTLSHQPCH